MDTPLSRDERRRLLLESLVERPAGADSDEGSYDPCTLERRIRLASAGSSSVARMVSWHEGFHAFLNASTCHGNAMIFAGVLASSGFTRFDALVGRLLDTSFLTHETYATVSAISAAARGAIDGTLLVGYPGYDAFLRTFTQSFPRASRPVLSTMTLASCARAAMQTPIYSQLLALPCDAWPDIEIDAKRTPDERFSFLMVQPRVEEAVSAMDAALRALGGRWVALTDPEIDAETERQLWLSADNRTLETVSRAAFDSFAESLADSVGIRCEYNDQQQGVRDLIAKVEAFAGDRLNRSLRTPESSADDETSLFSDFRHEHFILRESPLPAVFARYRPDLVRGFVLTIDGREYVQLVAMPLEKVRALYSPRHGDELAADDPDDIVVGLRRRISTQGSTRVEILLLTLGECSAGLVPLSDRGVELVVICSLHLFHRRNRFVPWLNSPECPATRVAVLIDDDPIELIDGHAEREAHLQLTYFGMRHDPAEEDHTEVVCLSAADEPDVIYFTPCSTPFRIALIEYARRRYTRVSLNRAFTDPWMPMLKWVMSHVVREEGRFGNRFWN